MKNGLNKGRNFLYSSEKHEKKGILLCITEKLSLIYLESEPYFENKGKIFPYLLALATSKFILYNLRLITVSIIEKPRPTTVSRAKFPESLEGLIIRLHKAQRQVVKTRFQRGFAACVLSPLSPDT
ncbi:hypothetical protein [Lysinibacillus composti]|uniref:hypothetical protein n=1 Tax=Lysinibacillus composti TaxID=720633 RepID=UPI0019617620|nr:hypothetical protein [Lysinibacillus composti]